MGYASDLIKGAKVTKTFSKKLNISGINEIKKFIMSKWYWEGYMMKSDVPQYHVLPS